MKKSKTRIFVSQTISSNLIIYIKNKQHHFLKNVLRVRINDEINIFDGITGEWKSIIISINRDNIALRVINNIQKFEKTADIWLIFAPIKQHRMSLAIQKATELGVSKIIPCITDYTNISNINEISLFYNAIEAAEQSERMDVPNIGEKTNLKTLLLQWPKDRKLIFCNEKITKGDLIINSLLPYKGKNQKWGVLIGPEGGFSDIETKLINKTENIIPVSLGKRLLRSDTAITVSLYCIQELLG